MVRTPFWVSRTPFLTVARIYHFIDSLLLYQLFQAVKVLQGDGTAR